jgi:hypothetical protein
MRWTWEWWDKKLGKTYRDLYIFYRNLKDYFTKNFECLLQIWKFKKIIILLKISSANCKYDNNGTFSYIGLQCHSGSKQELIWSEQYIF